MKRGGVEKDTYRHLTITSFFPLSFHFDYVLFFFSLFYHPYPITMSDTLQPKHRSSSYQRLKAKLKRSPSSYTAIDKKDWPRPQNVTDLLIHAIKGGGSCVSIQ